MKQVRYLPRYGETHLDSATALKARGPWHLCWLAICTQKRAVLQILSFGALGVIAMIGASFALSRLVKTIALQLGSESPVWNDLGLFLCVFLTLNLFNFLCYIEITKRQVEMAGPIRQELMLLLYTQTLRRRDGTGTTRKASGLVMRGARSFTEGTWCILIDIWPALLGLTVSLLLIAIFSPVLAGLTVFFSAFFFFYAYFAANRIYPKASKVSQARADVSRLLNIKLEKVPLANLFGQSGRELQSIKDGLTQECAVQDNYEKPKNASLNNLLLLSYAFRGVFVVFLLYLAGQGELQGHMLFFLLLLMQTFTASSISAANSFEKLLQSMSLFENAAKAIFDFDQRAPTNTSQNSKLSGSIRVVDLAYSYEESQKALNGISIEIAEGDKVAIVGESGSGKSTLFSILSGQLTPDSGSIWAGDVNISDLSPDLWNRHVSIVPQTISLFNRSVASNVGYALDQLHPEKVISAAQKANSDHFIQDTNEGYNTFMGEGGHRFSGGQRQRISIARSFAKDAAIYLLDEPTSTLDQHAEQHIFSSLNDDFEGKNDDFEGKTVVVVTHRLKHIDLFDRVIVMSDGQIVEDGPPEQLLSSDGYLKKLWKAQEVSWSKEPTPAQKTEPVSVPEAISDAPIHTKPFKDGVADEIVTFEDIEIPRLLKIATPAMRIMVLAGACMAGVLAAG